MALETDQTNYLSSAFFFNLADNSSFLDGQGGGQGFTVFGRILDGSNALEYFNGLTNGAGIVTNDIFSDNGTLLTNPFPENVLPVNYIGNALPANKNLVYCDFLYTNLPAVDTNLPTVSISSPASNVLITNGNAVATGTAGTESVLANVNAVLTPQAASDGTLPNGGTNLTYYATGTTNWTIDLFQVEDSFFGAETNSPPFGVYELSIQSQNADGYLSAAATRLLTNTAVYVIGNGSLSFTGAESPGASNNPIGYPYQSTSNYEVLATPGSGQTFLKWSAYEYATTDPTLGFPGGSGLFAATFISNSAGGITIAYPAANAAVPSGPVTVTGTIDTSILTPPVTVSCQQFTATVSNYALAAPVSTSNNTSSWSITFSNYPSGGPLLLQALATDSLGHTTLASNVIIISSIATNGNGSVTLSQGSTVIPNPIGYALQAGSNYSVQGVPSAGNIFVDWTYVANGNSYVVPSNPWTNFVYDGGLLTANFVSTNAPRGVRGITITYPPSDRVILTNNFLIKGGIARSFKPATVSVQVFEYDTALQVGTTLTTTTDTTSWSVPVSNLPPALYEVIATATNSTGYGAVTAEIFEVMAFKSIAGTYNGIFLCTTGPVAPTNSGFFTFTVSEYGDYSGRLQFPAFRPVPTVSYFDVTGADQFTCPIPGHPENDARVYLQLNLSGGPAELTGKLEATNGSWTSPLLCYRAATKLTAETIPPPGKYVLELNPANWGGTNGYASVIASAGGNLAVAGALPDGAAFSQSIKIATNGVWPIYTIPTGYKTGGMLMGWVTNGPTNSVTGQLYWYKSPDVGSYFTAGVVTNVNVIGTNYSGPAAGSYTIVFQGGSLAAPVTNQLSVAREGGQFQPVDDTDKLAISMSGTGVIAGHFTSDESNKPLQFKGIFLGKSGTGTGFILDNGAQTGYFILEPQ